MRRLFVAATLCAAVLLFAAPATLAASAPLHAAGHIGASARAPFATDRMDRVPLKYEPLARRLLIGSGTISLNVYTFDGFAEVGAEAGWVVLEGLDYGAGSALTDADGHVDLTGVPAATSDNGQVTVGRDDAGNTWVYDLGGMSWGDAGWSGGLQPGQLPLTIVRSGDSNWNNWPTARVRLFSEQGNEVHMALTDLVRTGETTVGNARTITTGPETLAAGMIHFWDDEGMELPVSGIAASSGMTASPAQTAREADAQRVWMDWWGSGKPGTRTWLVMDNFPGGWTNEVSGLAGWPRTATIKTFGTHTFTGDPVEAKRITIPSTAAPGYKYWVWTEHTSGRLWLETSFQTCTLKPSRSAVGRSTTIALSGVVPIKGHEGSKRGTPKYVHIYKTTSSRLAAKGQPPVNGGGTRAAGWTRIARIRTDGLGKYRKGSIRPGRTTWYVAWYPGDAWYWGAWTSVAKVTVR